MDLEDKASLIAALLKAEKEIKVAYYDNLRSLREIKAPTEVFDKLFDEADSVLKQLHERIAQTRELPTTE